MSWTWWRGLAGALVIATGGCRGDAVPEVGGATDDAADAGPGEGIDSLDDGLDPLPGPGSGEGRDPDQNPGCGSVEVDVQRTTPTLVLLVDQSGSMTTDFEGQQRWDAVYETLMAPGEGVVAKLESSVRFGLTLYSSQDGFDGGECPMLTTVEPRFGNLDAIDDTFSDAMPLDETPTGESLAAVAEQLAAFAEEGPKAIVLATDGEPDTCDTPNPQDGQPESLAAAEAAFALGIRTFVISVGNEVGDAHLQELANVGMGLPRNGPDAAPFYKALNADELIQAFDEIVGGFLLCEFQIDGQIADGRECDGAVTIDGEALQCGPEWEVQGSALRLIGDACERLGDGGQHVVDAQWPCGAIIPVP